MKTSFYSQKIKIYFIYKFLVLLKNCMMLAP